jgi:hypothetical protein
MWRAAFCFGYGALTGHAIPQRKTHEPLPSDRRSLELLRRICGSSTVWITTDQAIEIYARFCAARYGANAKRMAADRAVELGHAGDDEGERVWRAVKQKIEAQAQN